MIIIQGTRRGGLYEIVGTVESTSTVVSADTPTWRVVGGDDMIGCSGAATVETRQMTMSVIVQLHEQSVDGGDMFGHLEFRGRLGNGVGRRGYVVDDAAWGIEYVRPWVVDSNLMR
jgi:hypothetical protein